jgi:hypothetical protein
MSLEQDTFLLHSDQKSAFLAEVEQKLYKVKSMEENIFTAPYTLHPVGYSLICVEKYPKRSSQFSLYFKIYCSRLFA